jgi:hypothetical protein
MQLGWKILRACSSTLGALGLVCWLWPAASAAADEAADPSPAVSLDQLLRLPDSLKMETSRRGGATRAEWHARFLAAQADVEAAEADLAESMAEMEDLAGQSSNWKMSSPLASPGAKEDNSSLNYGLKQTIRRKKTEVERTERVLLDLEIEANLGGVPEEWYSPQ